jgi:hypothetical protein
MHKENGKKHKNVVTLQNRVTAIRLFFSALAKPEKAQNTDNQNYGDEGGFVGKKGQGIQQHTKSEHNGVQKQIAAAQRSQGQENKPPGAFPEGVFLHLLVQLCRSLLGTAQLRQNFRMGLACLQPLLNGAGQIRHDPLFDIPGQLQPPFYAFEVLLHVSFPP